MKKVLFIDRDGTLALEPEDFQLDSLEKLVFYPGVFTYLGKIAREMDYELVMVTNQDGLGTESFPEEDFWPTHHFLLKSFENEGVKFHEVLIDKSFPSDNAPTRKPRTGLLTAYLDDSKYDRSRSFVIGDRLTDMELSKNLGAKGIFLAQDDTLGADEVVGEVESSIALKTTSWKAIYDFLKLEQRVVRRKRTTNETAIEMALNLDGSGKSKIHTGIAFF